MPTNAVKDFTPNVVLIEKKPRSMYDVNYEKSLKNDTVSDIDINAQVRI